MADINTADLARSITWQGSKQSYYTARLMVDRDLVDDFLRAYAYFRWMDDVIDISSSSSEERTGFIERQKELIDILYKQEIPDGLTQEEEILADLIRNDRFDQSGLQSFIKNMFAIIEFDAHRKGRLISGEELDWYTDRLARSVTDGLQYFVGNGYPYPQGEDRLLAAEAAHITHLLRDMVEDTEEGFINIPKEFLKKNGIGPLEFDSEIYRDWVKERVELSRSHFERGKRYLDSLGVLRCKLAGHWYCARFEGVLDMIEGDGYNLRSEYSESRNLSTWMQIAWLGIIIPVRHATHR
ncbi:MAG TPA: squalene/phytoene synthase family protein [candidate division Zixibacteria bacterium]|nr:squalene/phytoene synthase family protein [candidate division Zixibacteria bacterium]